MRVVGSRRTGTCVAVVSLLLACHGGIEEGPTRLRGATVSSFQDGQLPGSGYAGTRDTMLEGGSPGTKNGGDASLSVEEEEALVALLAWDVAGIPTTAVIDAVSVTLEVSDRSSQSFNFYAARRAWSEAQATWKESAAGSAWQSGGAHGANDRGSAVLGSFSAANTGAVTIPLNAAGVAVVQGWVAQPATNLGFVLDGPGTDNRLEFRASEYGTKSKRPRLTVTWHEGDAGETTGETGDEESTGEESGEDTGEVVLEKVIGNYRQTCDGSFGVALDSQYFVDGNDEDQGLRIYLRGADAGPVKTIDVSAGLGVAGADEVDLEDAARIGDRMFAVSSHGRNKDGKLERMRYRFFALDVGGTVPNVSLTMVGYTSTLLDQLIKSANWVTPNQTVIAALAAASNLGKATDASLAPKLNGSNIEGLAWLPTASRPRQLVLGFRNPVVGSDAILVTLLNADAVVTGATAQFGEATLLNLGGLRVRGMAWSPVHAAVLILAGPKDSGGPFRLYRWAGGGAATLVTTIDEVPADSGPEAIVVYPNTRDVQVLFDQGEHLIGGTICKDKSASSRYLSDAIVHVP
jgi:hypothetical protein